MAKKYFKENQHFRRWEVIGMLAFFIIGLTVKFSSQHWFSPVDNPMPLYTYLIFTLPLAGCLWYLMSLKLTVEVTDKSIKYKYFPWQRKKHKIKWKDVEEFELVKTPPAAQWSGWDVRFDHEKMYSLTGRTGIHLKTTEGDDIIIGSRNFRGLREAVNQAYPEFARQNA